MPAGLLILPDSNRPIEMQGYQADLISRQVAWISLLGTHWRFTTSNSCTTMGSLLMQQCFPEGDKKGGKGGVSLNIKELNTFQ